MTIEDLSTYSEVDPNSRLSTTTTAATGAAVRRNETAYQHKDFGAGYFGVNHYVEGEFTLSAPNGASYKGIHAAFSDTLDHADATVNQAGAFLSINSSNTAVIVYPHKRESSSGSSTPASGTYSIGTKYYHRNGILSCLGGEFGAVVLQNFSDSGRATFVGAAVLPRTAAATYRYYLPLQSKNNGTADYMTSVHESITLFTATAGIDLTAGVETDTGTGRLAVFPDCIVATALNIANSETAKHVAIDEGADFFADYTVSDVLNVTAFANGAFQAMFNILTVCDAAADASALNDSQGIGIYWITSTTYKPYILQRIGGAVTASTAGPVCNTSQPVSITLNRSGTTLTMKVWNDLVLDANYEGTSLVDTVTWTGRATTTYRYLMPVTSALSGATSRSSTFTLGGVQRSGGSAPYEVSGAETAATGDAAASTTAFSLAAAETAAITDTGAFTVAQAVNAVETATTYDAATGGIAGSTACAETAIVTDTASVTIEDSGVAEVSAAETAVVADAASALVGVAGYIRRFWRIVKYDETLGKDVPATGLNPVPQYMLLRPADGLTCDFGDSGTMKLAAACVDYQGNMVEFDADRWPGAYYYLLRTDVLADGKYLEAGDVPQLPGFFTDLEEIMIYDGEMIDPLAAAQIVAAAAARIVDGDITGEIFDKTVLAFAAGKRRGLVAGAAIPALEEYLRQDGSTAQISLSPTDVAGNGTPVINQDP